MEIIQAYEECARRIFELAVKSYEHEIAHDFPIIRTIKSPYSAYLIEYILGLSASERILFIRSMARSGVYATDAWARPDVPVEEHQAYKRAMNAFQLFRVKIAESADAPIQSGVPRRKLAALVVPKIREFLGLETAGRLETDGSFDTKCNGWWLNFWYDFGGRSNPGLSINYSVYRSDVGRYTMGERAKLRLHHSLGVGFNLMGISYEIRSEDDVSEVIGSLGILTSHILGSILEATKGLGIDD